MDQSLLDRFNRIVPLLKRNDPIINSLNMSSIQLTDEMMENLIDALNYNKFISKMVLQQNSLTPKACNMLFDLLYTNPKLEQLEIVKNNVNDDSIKHLANVLMKLPHTRAPINLSLRSNNFTEVGAKYLSDALAANVPVYWLDLRYNENIKDRGIEFLAFSLMTNTVLSGLDVIKCGCGENSAAAFSDSLVENHSLKTLLLQDELTFNAISSLSLLFSDPQCSLQALYLWHCSLNAQMLEILCHHIRKNKSLNTLALSYNKIDDSGGIYLADMILRNTSITKLQLGANHFSPTSAGYFGVALTKNKTLQFLDLSRNNLRSLGLWPIAISLKNNKTLKNIDLRYNKIEAKSAEIICELLSENTSITNMRLSGNFFDDQSISMIAQCLKTNQFLKDIELDEIQMGSTGFIAICQALKYNNTLEKISINQNQITSSSLISFSELLKVNTSLQSIDMKKCSINDKGCQYIAEGIASNSTLIELDISNNSIEMAGANLILESLQGNYSLMKLEINENPFNSDEACHEINNKIADFLERNNYYQHNILMKDMSALATDNTFL